MTSDRRANPRVPSRVPAAIVADGDWVKLTVHYEGCERALASEEYAEIGPGGLLVYTFSGSDPRQVEGGRCDISITTGYSPETWTIRRAGPIRTGINELGVLRRSRAPVLAKGRVFHATGEPAGGIQVRARTPRESAGPDDRNKSAWVRITSSTTAPDGSFELRHEHEGSFVLAYSQLTIPARLREVRSGVEGLSLVLPETGAVTGSVRIPSGLDTIGFTAKFLSTPDIPDGPSADQGAPAPLVAVHKIEDDGSFLAPDLVPGTYRVELRADPWRAPFAAVDGVLVEAGATCRDPRLADIPLGNLDTHDLELVDTAGRPVPEGRVTWRALDDPPWRFRGTADFHDGRFVLYTDLEAVEVSVEAEHHHERTVAPIHADARIVLRAWQELAISLRPSLAEAFPQLDFELELAGPGEDPEDEPKGWDETIPAQGSRTWRVDRPGTWWAWLTCVDGGAEIEASIERPLRLEVLDTAEVQEFVLDVRVSDVAALLEATHDPD